VLPPAPGNDEHHDDGEDRSEQPVLVAESVGDGETGAGSDDSCGLVGSEPAEEEQAEQRDEHQTWQIGAHARHAEPHVPGLEGKEKRRREPDGSTEQLASKQIRRHDGEARDDQVDHAWRYEQIRMDRQPCREYVIGERQPTGTGETQPSIHAEIDGGIAQPERSAQGTAEIVCGKRRIAGHVEQQLQHGGRQNQNRDGEREQHRLRRGGAHGVQPRRQPFDRPWT
jgi:hypothetical protein